jgi:hypothetical protein
LVSGPEVVRTRISRGTLDSVQDHGRVFVLLEHDRTPSNPNLMVNETAFTESLRDHLLAAALERIPPQLEAPAETSSEPVRAPESASEVG